MGYANIQADSNFYRQSLNADGVKYVTGPYTSLYEDVFRAVTVTTDSVVSVTSYVGDSLSNQFLLAGTEIYGLFSSVTIHSGKAVLHLAGASYISEIINQYSASGIPLGFYEEGTQCLSQKISALLTQGIFDDASWVMVPSQYEEDWVRAFKPTSELGNLAFTRSSDATFTDSTGVVRRSPWNLVTYSEMFSDVAWIKGNVTVSINSTIAPNGTLTADTITASGASATKNIVQFTSITSGFRYNISIYAKKDTNDFIQVYAGATLFGTDVWANFNIATGTVGSVGTATTASIQDAGNGWYRCSISALATGTGNTFSGLYAIVSSATAPRAETNTLSTSVFIWGAQIVEGTEALPYFATTDRLNVPRLDYRNADGTLSTCPRLLLEPQRTNSIRNSSMVGAVVGGFGTLPTNWTASGSGLSRSVVGFGVLNGLPYIDVRIFGTATNTFFDVFPEASNVIAATSGQTWSNSFYLQIIATPAGPVNTVLAMREFNSGGIFLSVYQGSAITISNTTLQRFTQTRAIAQATAAFVQSSVFFTLINGAAYDFTIRIAAPQMELGAYATTWVPTTTAAVTRIADNASKTGVSSIIGQSAGTIFWDIIDLTGTPTSTGNPDFAIRNTAFTNWIGITTNSFALPFRVVVRPTSGGIINYEANITRAKAAVAWSSAGAVLYVNGAQVGTSAVNPNFSFDIIQMLGGIISYKTNQAALFPVRLDNATLAALTTL